MIICHFNHLSETCELHEFFFGHEALLLLLDPVLISATLVVVTAAGKQTLMARFSALQCD